MQKIKKINQNNKKLFENLNKLANNSDTTFHRIDVISSMQTKFVIFGYHIAQYSDWLLPAATESRGIMFEVDENDNPIRIASRPMEKFWNYKENPFTEKIDFVQYLFRKEDGSLISTFLDKDELFLKSKSSLFSQQALDAQSWLYSKSQENLLKAIKEYTDLGYTVNMEWVSPDNRIVVGYDEPRLIILNIRDNISGNYVAYEELLKDSEIHRYLVKPVKLTEIEDILKSIEDMENEEGYVLWQNDKPFCKIKCPWYINLHSVKSELNSDKNLWTSVAAGLSDDIKILFQSDGLALKRISDFEKMYKNSFNTVYNICLSVYNDLIGQSRKDYAINSQAKLNSLGYPKLFGVVMRMYLDGTDNLIDMIKDHLVKEFKLYIEG